MGYSYGHIRDEHSVSLKKFFQYLPENYDNNRILTKDIKKRRISMSKELDALARQKANVKELRNIKYIDYIQDFTLLEKALNQLEDAKHNYKVLKEMYNNAVAYASKIERELNELIEFKI